MNIELTAQQESERAAFRAFVEEAILPRADQYEREEYTPPDIIEQMARLGYLGALVPSEYGGIAQDMITYGLLNEELGRGCSSVRSLLTVHSMVEHAILRWGNAEQKAAWLPRLASGEITGAFGLSEPEVGSDASSIETEAQSAGDAYILNGRKRWTTYGQIAGLFLIFARCDGKVTAFLLERDRPGLEVAPISGMIGTRASMLAELTLRDCRIPKENLLGGRGFGLAAVATSALDIGRYTVAWGCVGIAQACLEASLHYTQKRRQFGSYLKDHQLVRQMISKMMVNVRAARLLCLHAGSLKDAGDPRTIMETWIAKYFASTTASQTASDAVQLQGAYGCNDANPVQRYWRDARVMEVIEGSTQIQEITIAGYGYQN